MIKKVLLVGKISDLKVSMLKEFLRKARVSTAVSEANQRRHALAREHENTEARLGRLKSEYASLHQRLFDERAQVLVTANAAERERLLPR